MRMCQRNEAASSCTHTAHCSFPFRVIFLCFQVCQTEGGCQQGFSRPPHLSLRQASPSWRNAVALHAPSCKQVDSTEADAGIHIYSFSYSVRDFEAKMKHGVAKMMWCAVFVEGTNLCLISYPPVSHPVYRNSISCMYSVHSNWTEPPRLTHTSYIYRLHWAT